jgi:hypothetical protein
MKKTKQKRELPFKKCVYECNVPVLKYENEVRHKSKMGRRMR